MATKIRRTTSQKQIVRFKRKRRILSRMEGTQERPRMSVFRSNKHFYVQLIDDVKGHTLVSACTLEEELKAEILWLSALWQRTSRRWSLIAAVTSITVA
jgi:ribosomal protein L18